MAPRILVSGRECGVERAQSFRAVRDVVSGELAIAKALRLTSSLFVSICFESVSKPTWIHLTSTKRYVDLVQLYSITLNMA